MSLLPLWSSFHLLPKKKKCTCIYVHEIWTRYLYRASVFVVDLPSLLLQSKCSTVQEEMLPAGARYGLPSCSEGFLPDGPRRCGKEGNWGLLEQHLNQCPRVTQVTCNNEYGIMPLISDFLKRWIYFCFLETFIFYLRFKKYILPSTFMIRLLWLLCTNFLFDPVISLID